MRSQLLVNSPLIMCSQLFTLVLLALSLTLATSQEPTQKTGRLVNQTGQLGLPGNPGQPCVDKTGILLVKHSQTNIVPDCHPGHKKLWDGYSFLYIENGDMGHSQDLGTAGSCLAKFSMLPFLSCELNDVCSYRRQYENSYWLSTNASMPVEEHNIKEHISRCVVCEVPANVIAVHSQSNVVLECPAGWNSLWTGYSFIMHTFGGGQKLASPGSCLEDFRETPFIKCNGEIGCYFRNPKISFWLANIEDRDQFVVPRSQVLKNGDLLQKVSRCTVCIRTI